MLAWCCHSPQLCWHLQGQVQEGPKYSSKSATKQVLSNAAQDQGKRHNLVVSSLEHNPASAAEGHAEASQLCTLAM